MFQIALSIPLYVEYQDVLTRPEHMKGISTTQFLILAAAEKMSAILTENYLEEEANKGKREDFDKVMKAVPSVEPEEYDRIV